MQATQDKKEEEDSAYEAEYELEFPVTCPSCTATVKLLNVVRTLRTKVNFTSSLPRRGFAVICPGCKSVVSASVGGIMGI